MTQSTEKPQIVIADDSRVIRKSVMKYLAEGYTIHECEDGAIAWELLQANPQIQLLLSDLGMPNMDGYQLLQSIRGAEDEALRELPVIIVTGQEDTSGAKERLLALGATDLIGKPFDPAELRSRVGGYCGMQRQLAAAEQRCPKDKLTGLLLKEHFLKQGENMLSFAHRHAHGISAVRLGMDKFDSLVAQVGRATADKIIANVAKRFDESIRQEDIAAYFGDGQFGLFLIGTDAVNTEQLIAGLHKRLALLKFKIGEQLVQVSFSIGISTLAMGDEVEDVATLLGQAEQAFVEATTKGEAQSVHYAKAPVGRTEVPADMEVSLDELLERIAAATGELSPAELTVGMRRILPLLSAADAQLKLGLSKVTTYLEHRLRVE